MADLDDLRSRIDQLDGALIAIVAERLAVCRQVAAVKEGTDTPVIQPARVRDVVDSRRHQAIEAGIDPDFAEQLFRVLLTETHRIEVAGQRPDAAPEKPASTGEARSGLDTVATRVDHIVIAVEDLDLAGTTLQRFGFHDVPMAGTPHAGIRTVAAGGVILVLVGPAASANVADYLERHGPRLPCRRRHAAADRGTGRRRRSRTVLRRLRAGSRYPTRVHLPHGPSCRRWLGQRLGALRCNSNHGHMTSRDTVEATHDR
jgi:chorismate mutase-like protein